MISEFFIKNKILLAIITLFFTLGGFFAFKNLNRNEDPGFKIRTASIITKAPAFNAEKIDSYITRPIENRLLEMEEIEDIREESTAGLSVLYADLYEYYDNIQPIWDRLRRKVALAVLPGNAQPVVNDEFADVYGALIGVSKEGADYEELYDTADFIRDEFLKLQERGKAEITGTQEEVLYLNFKDSYFNNLKLTPDKMQALISAANIIGGGGTITNSKNEIGINSKNEINSVRELKNTVIDIEGKPIPAGDIFNIEKTVRKPVSKLVRSNGKDALIIAVSLKKGGNILKWGKEIQNTLILLKKKYPDIKLEILALQSEYVKTLTEKFTSSLFESILAVILIVFLILGLKTGAIVGFIILTAVSSVFLVMAAFGIGLDKISLSALIISLGILVDNSIVIAQGCLNCPQNTQASTSDNGRLESYSDACRHIIETANKFQLPLFIVTLTTSLSFLPVFIAKSTVGEYASNIFTVISITLLFSWFYSVSLLPCLMLKFGREDKRREIFFISFIKDGIRKAVKHYKIVVAAGLVAFLISFALFCFVPKVFFPDSDRNMFEIRLNLKNGVSFEETKRATLRVEDFLASNKDISSYSSYIGTSAPRYVLSASPDVDRTNFAMLLANTKTYKTVENDIRETKKFINYSLPKVQAVVRKIPLGPPVDAPVEIRIKDESIDKLFMYAKTVSAKLSGLNGVYLVKNNWGDSVLQYDIKINENTALMAGVAPYTVFNYLDALYNGKTLTYYYRGENKVPIVLMGNIEKLKSAALYSQNYGVIPLRQVADIEEVFTYSKILRRNNSYVLTVQGWIDETTTADKICRELKPDLDKISGLEYEFGGTVEKSRKGNKSVIEKIPFALGLIVLILVWYFNSLIKPFLILFCGFLALTGANFGLFLTGSDFGFITFLGYICLIGICVNNGVILLNEIKEKNSGVCEAGTEPGDGQNTSGNKAAGTIEDAAISRVEPILLTCLTTIAGMLPLWLKNDPMFSTLAISIIFGLLSSIMITLFFLPAMYTVLSSRSDFFRFWPKFVNIKDNKPK